MATNLGPRTLEGGRDRDGYREYRVGSLISIEPGEGPAAVIDCPGLYAVGQEYSLGTDSDLWAFCTWEMRVKRHQGVEGSPVRYFIAEQVFSSKPPELQRCNATPITDPLLEPVRISGGSVRYSEEGVFDRFGVPVQTTAFEFIRGPQNEWDGNRPNVRVSVNVPNFLPVALAYQMEDGVNPAPLWGLPARCIKLSSVTWERKYYGICYCYFTLTMDFDVNRLTFDRDLLDEGNLALSGHQDPITGAWVLDKIGGVDPNPKNPLHFIRYKDKNGENRRCILDGLGKPYDPVGHIREGAANVVSNDGPWTNPNNALGLHDAVDATTTNGDTELILSGYSAPIPAPVILTVRLAFYTQVTDAPTAGHADMLHEYDVGAGMVVLDSFDSDVFNNPKIYDITAAIAGDWAKIVALKVGVKTQVATAPVGDVLFDAVELLVDYVGSATPGKIHVEKYPEANFLLLGVPTDFTC